MKLKREDFSGTFSLIPFILRRDRIISPILILSLNLFVVIAALFFIEFYTEAVLREAFVLQISSNPAIVALLGPIQDSSVGGLVAWRTRILGAVFMGLLSMFLMIRHTRSEESKGRMELLNSTAVGRLAILTSTLIYTCLINLIIGILIVISFFILELPLEGSMAMAFSMVAFGCLFAAITGINVQLSERPSDAWYITISILIAFFLLHIMGWEEGGIEWLSWFTPLGWIRYIRAFADEQWWILGLFLVLTSILIFIAYLLASKRDLGAGIIPQRNGPARASFTLQNILGLTWRLQRGKLIFWITVFSLAGFMLGNMVPTITDLFMENPQMMIFLQQIGSNVEPLDLFLTMILVIITPAIAAYGISAALKLKSEEKKNYSEFLLINTVSRTRWALSNLIFALIGPAMILLALTSTYCLGYGLFTNNIGQEFLEIFRATLAYLPAIWILVGISMCFFGIKPRLTSFSWFSLGIFILITILEDFTQISQWILNISPFTHVPKLLLGESISSYFYLLFAITVILIFLGIIGYQHRDITR